MNEAQRKIVWVALAVLALPVGILVGEASGSVLLNFAVFGAILGAAMFVRAGGKPKDET